MNITKQNMILCFILLLIVGLACNRFKSNSSNQNTANTNQSDIGGNSGKDQKPKRDPNEKIFKGAIYTGESPSLIMMKLKREGNQMTGTYYYLKTRKDIAINGSIDTQGKFKFEETSEGKVTGVFTGVWKDSEKEPLIILDGQWKKSGSKDEWYFFASEQPFEASEDKKIEDKAINEENKKLRYTVGAYYPQLSGFGEKTDVINKDIFSVVNGDIAEFRKSMQDIGGEAPIAGSDVSYSLDISNNTMIATDDLVSFELTMYDYSGGAHPNSYTKTLTYEVKSGKRLSLSDLFKPSSNYLKTISDYCISALKKQMRDTENGIEPDEQMIQEGASAKSENYETWNIAKKGLVITFDPYQVGPYAAGPQVVVVPYKILKEIIKEDGVLFPIAK